MTGYRPYVRSHRGDAERSVVSWRSVREVVQQPRGKGRRGGQ